MKGKTPTGGLYALYNGQVKNATLCVNGYTVTYQEKNTTVGEKCTEESLRLTASLRLSKSITSLTYPAEEEIEVTENTSGGSLSCTSSDTDAATCSISGNIVKITAGTKEAEYTVITVTSAATSKYNSTNAVVVVTSENGLMSVTANGYTGDYDGEAHGITVISSGATIKYGTTSGTYDLDQSPTYTSVGTYTVYYQVTKTGYKTVTGSKTVTISQLTASSVTYTNNGQSTVQGALDNLFTKF